MTLRKKLLIVWFICVGGSGALLYSATGNIEMGIALSLTIVGISIGVPIMRAHTEFSK